MKRLFKVLDFFRIIDSNHKLSLTNLVIFVAIYKIFVAPQFSIPEVTTLLISMLSYGHKKYMEQKTQKLTDENKQAIADIQAKVNLVADKASGLAMHVGLRTPIVK